MNTLGYKFTYPVIICLLLIGGHVAAQRGLIEGGRSRLQNIARAGSGGTTDSLRRRDMNEDSITISYRFLDSTRNYKLDSSIADFTRRFPIPGTFVTLGNNGTAAHSLLFSPLMNPGWDPGFHAFDIYKWSVEKVRFFQSTRPYSEINYQLATRSEQIIELMHTQNIKPNWNFGFQYRLISAPGIFKNQKSNHNNYLVNSHYESVNKRYNNYFILLGNKLQAGESGGLRSDVDYLTDPDYKDRYGIPTQIGGDQGLTRNFFNTDVGTGNRYNEFRILMRQQYDFGKKDSLVTDSTVIPLFFPRVRFEHTFQYSQQKFLFRDWIADSVFYDSVYGIVLPKATDSVQIQDSWSELVNDFSIYQFPDAKNLQQFIKLGAGLQNLKQTVPDSKGYYNVFGHAEYRNRTRNRKWDVLLSGKLYFTGLNAGDYSAYATLQRSTGGKVPGYAELGFQNVNRTPSFIFNEQSDFYLMPSATDFKKENTTRFFANLYQPALRLKLSGNYYLLTNYTYVTDYYQLRQFGSLFNVLSLSAEKTFRLGKRFRWHSEVYFQQAVGNAPVNLPTVYTRNRIGYEGNLGFKNLDLAAGLEARYHTPYKADNYSPVLGQFFYQDSIRINNPLPDIAAYIHFRIRSFKAYLRAENLNTAEVTDAFGFTNNNQYVPGYPYPGLVIRFGIYWSFIN